ncbi:MAG: hypothetical protein NVSMB2_18990 [Chloroflexota bacterium]
MNNQMVEDILLSAVDALDLTYGALADPSRRHILDVLRNGGERRVSDLARPLPMSFNAVSKHIKVLERAGLVQRRIIGRDHYISLARLPLDAAASWLEDYRDRRPHTAPTYRALGDLWRSAPVGD